MLNPLVSIVIPTYNRLASLAELIEALSRQTYKNFEVIIVNDAGESVEEITDVYSQLTITIINQKKNMLHIHARNRGVEEAKGELIMLIDDDDLILPTHLEAMVNEIEDCQLVYSDAEIIQYVRKGNVRFPIKRLLFAYELELEEMRKFSTFIPSGCLYRKEIHKAIGPFDVEMVNYWDWDFFLRVSEKFKVKRHPVASVLYEFSEGGDNLSKDLTSMRPNLDRLSKKHQLGYLPTKNFFLLLEEPEVKKRKATSKQLWDGKPIVSKLSKNNEDGIMA